MQGVEQGSELRVLVVVAHPDDEVLGCGGTMSVLSAGGHPVTTCILAGDVDARDRRPDDDALREDTLTASAILGATPPILGSFPNIRMNSVPHLELVKFIENAIVETSANWLFTHHPHDLNDDHRQVSAAAQAAARLFQRGDRVGPLRGLAFMEVASSTDWQFAGTTQAFEPNAFVPIGRQGLDRKLHALGAYRDVMRPFPHPRSPEVITGMATVHAARSGLGYAEAFQIVHLDLTHVWS